MGNASATRAGPDPDHRGPGRRPAHFGDDRDSDDPRRRGGRKRWLATALRQPCESPGRHRQRSAAVPRLHPSDRRREWRDSDPSHTQTYYTFKSRRTQPRPRDRHQQVTPGAVSRGDGASRNPRSRQISFWFSRFWNFSFCKTQIALSFMTVLLRFESLTHGCASRLPVRHGAPRRRTPRRAAGFLPLVSPERRKSLLDASRPRSARANPPAIAALLAERIRPQMAPQRLEKIESAPGNGMARKLRTPTSGARARRRFRVASEDNQVDD